MAKSIPTSSALMFLIFLIVSSCSEKIDLGQSFIAKVGNDYKVSNNLEFRIDSVHDGRCPKEFFCLTGGSANIYVKFLRRFHSPIDTIISFSGNPVVISNYAFKVLSLFPEPSIYNKPAQADFKVEMIVYKN